MKFFLGIVTVLVATTAFAQIKPNVNTKPYPYQNPVIRHMYTADAAPHVFPDGKVWMVTSVDHENGGGYSTMHKYHTFSSSDMRTWQDHGEIFSIKDVLGTDVEPENEDWALWAPDMIYKNGKYYLYYPIRKVLKDETGESKVESYIAVAVGDSPDKRFTVLNPKIEGTKGIDPSVFIDDDGEAYLYWGSHMAAKLKDNMAELATKPVQLEVDTDRFMEAVWMNKYEGKYYISYHTKYDWKIKLTPENMYAPDRKKSELAYSVGDSPMGPFTYKGTLNYELGVNVKNGVRSVLGDFTPWQFTQSNHGGIVEYHGLEYLFYHTSALSSWRQDEFKGAGTWTQRSVCIDKIVYKPNGDIIPVQQTIESVAPVTRNPTPEQKLIPVKGKTADGGKIKSTKVRTGKGAMVVPCAQVDLGTGYYYFDVETSDPNAIIEIRQDAPDGLLLGTAKAMGRDKAETFLRRASGKHTLYLVVKQAKPKTKLTSFRVLGG